VFCADIFYSFLDFVGSFDRGCAYDYSINSHVYKTSGFSCVTNSATKLNGNIYGFDYGCDDVGIGTHSVSCTIEVDNVHFTRTLVDPTLGDCRWVIVEYGFTIVVTLGKTNAASVS
jgi:hypothetical protein